jgi:hypothetical protein
MDGKGRIFADGIWIGCVEAGERAGDVLIVAVRPSIPLDIRVAALNDADAQERIAESEVTHRTAHSTVTVPLDQWVAANLAEAERQASIREGERPSV